MSVGRTIDLYRVTRAEDWLYGSGPRAAYVVKDLTYGTAGFVVLTDDGLHEAHDLYGVSLGVWLTFEGAVRGVARHSRGEVVR